MLYSMSARALPVLALMTIASCGVTAKGDSLAYAETIGGNVGTLDLNTGVYTYTGTSLFGSEGGIEGLGVQGGNVYEAVAISDPSSMTNSLDVDQIVPHAFSTANTGNLLLGSFGSNANGLYFLGSVNGSPMSLYSILASNTYPLPTTIGQVNLASSISFEALSSNTSSTALYALATNGPTGDFFLYQISPTTGAATLIGDTSIANPGAASFEQGALVFENGTLWMTLGSAEYTLNTTTGQTTFVTDLTGFPVGGNIVQGLAPDVTSNVSPPTGTPEPSSLSMLVLSAGVALYARKRVRRWTARMR